MFSLFGAPALSPFRLDQLLRALKLQDSRVASLASCWIHFIDARRELSAPESAVLSKLLTYGPRAPGVAS
jgi:phosphoribosylformylglycinamidine synthase